MRNFHPGLWLAGFLLFLWVPRSIHAQEQDIQFVTDPSTVTAGRTWTVWLKSNQEWSQASVTFHQRKNYFYSQPDGSQRALLGIPSLEKTGSKTAYFKGMTAGGRLIKRAIPFFVKDGKYPTSRVKLPRQKDSLLKKMRSDAKILEHVYTQPGSAEKLWSGYFVLPATGVFSSPFGTRRSYNKGRKLLSHSGLDIANAAGTPILAPNHGRVVLSRRLESFGHVVMLDHGHGVFSYYLHMPKTDLREGDLVRTGTFIGPMGSEGVATGPHLHWSFVVGGDRVEPLEWIEREFP